MTAPKSAYRRRFRADANAIPEDLTAWFRDGGSPPWSALLPVWRDGRFIEGADAVVARAWDAWKRSHPDAKPPAGWEWIVGEGPS